MITIKVQVKPLQTIRTSVEYVEYSAPNGEDIEKSMRESAKYMSELHTFAPIPIWETCAKELGVDFKIKFHKNFSGLLGYLAYRIYKLMYTQLPRQRYIEIYDVKVTNE